MTNGNLNFFAIILAGLMGVSACHAGPAVVGARSRTFKTPTNLNGVTVVGRVSFYATNNVVEFARLARDQVAWGRTPLPAGTGVKFRPDGRPTWCFLAKDYEIRGHLLNGGGHEWMTCFYPNGELESGGLVHVEVIDGIPCEAAAKGIWGKHPRTHFYADGKLKSAQVAVTFRHRGQIIAKGKHIELEPDGSIESIK
jgi:hypothetical protein